MRFPPARQADQSSPSSSARRGSVSNCSRRDAARSGDSIRRARSNATVSTCPPGVVPHEEPVIAAHVVADAAGSPDPAPAVQSVQDPRAKKPGPRG